tara:strand:+ start:160 stop:324 length:165 start_codon:yes stop_codon:yes gene_type:complete
MQAEKNVQPEQFAQDRIAAQFTHAALEGGINHAADETVQTVAIVWRYAFYSRAR